jgi:hypothetical protein
VDRDWQAAKAWLFLRLQDEDEEEDERAGTRASA